MKRRIIPLVGVLLLTIVVLSGLLACAKPSPTPTPTPKPTPSPTPTAAPTPKPTPTPTPTAAAETVVLTFSTAGYRSPGFLAFQPPDFRFAELMEKRSQGRIKLDMKPGLFGTGDTPLATGQGKIDIGVASQGYVSGTWPLWAYASLPFVFDDKYQYERATNDPAMGKALEASYRNANLIRLAEYTEDGNNTIWSKSPIDKVDTFKGLKIRAPGAINTPIVQRLGATPVTVLGPEVVDALRKGVMDAALSDRIWAFASGITDAAKYANYWPFSIPYPQVILMNVDKWNKLSPELQKIVVDVSLEMAGQLNYATVATLEQINKAIELAGVKFIVPSKEEVKKAEDLNKTAVADWLKQTGSEGEQVLSVIAKYTGKSYK